MLQMQRLCTWTHEGYTKYFTLKTKTEMASFWFTARWHCLITRRFLVTVLQTDLKWYQIFKEKLVYLKKQYKTILKNVKKGYWGHTTQANTYQSSLKRNTSSSFKIVSTVSSPKGGKKSSLLSTTGHPQYKEPSTMIWTTNGNFF